MRLAIDDFGTGYASLNLLQSLRPDEVKIDQTFIRGMTIDPYARRIVALLAGMAPLMGVEIVAEGVDTRACFQALRDLGINRFQGYLFSRPLPPERFSGLVFPPAISAVGA
jgi:EAL domain-containing protein (putative c-di-GMP-specific phosphodiesterase class I)